MSTSGSPAAGIAGALGRRSDRVLTVALFALALLLAFAFAYPRQWTEGLLINDEFWHAHLARNVYEGQGYVADSIAPMHAPQAESFPAKEAWKQPLYPVLVGWIWKAAGVDIRWFLVVSMLAFGSGVAITFRLGRVLGLGRTPALLVASLVAVAPLSLAEHVTANPEALYMALFLASVLAVLREDTAGAVGAGLAHAALVLTKGHGLLYVPVFGCFLFVAAAARRPGPLRAVDGTRLAGTYALALIGGMAAGAVVLPAGSVQLLSAGDTYSLGFLLETAQYPNVLPYSQVHPPDPWAFVASHPVDYGVKVLRMASRTKFQIDALAGPALGALLFPLLWLGIGAEAARWLGLMRPGPADGDRGGSAHDGRLRAALHRLSDRDTRVALLPVALVLPTFAFFWTWRITERYVLHLLPLMLLLAVFGVRTIARAAGIRAESFREPARSWLMLLATLWLCLYPATWALWRAYREPHVFLGRTLAVRYLDYSRVRELVEEHVPPGAVLVTDMNHEIAWLNDRPTVSTPLSESDLAYLVDRYDAQAVYEHPRFTRDWETLRRRFVLVDDSNGRLWVRADRRP